MAMSRTVIRVCHLVSALVAVVILTAGDELYTAWGCYGTLRLDALDLGCCGDDPHLRWVADAGGPAAVCRFRDCEPAPAGQTAWFGRAAAVAAHFQVRIPPTLPLPVPPVNPVYSRQQPPPGGGGRHVHCNGGDRGGYSHHYLTKNPSHVDARRRKTLC